MHTHTRTHTSSHELFTHCSYGVYAHSYPFGLEKSCSLNTAAQCGIGICRPFQSCFFPHYVQYIALQILEGVVKTRWKTLPRAQCEGIRGYIVGLNIKLSSDPTVLEVPTYSPPTHNNTWHSFSLPFLLFQNLMIVLTRDSFCVSRLTESQVLP